jgi:hypothetical protein
MHPNTPLSVSLSLPLAFLISSCGGAASHLTPNQIPAGHGAIFGRVEAFDGGKDVTGSCYVEFTDQAEQQKARVSLDESGWIFISVPSGPTYLSEVACSSGAVVTRDLVFRVGDRRTITYFGYVEVDTKTDNSNQIAGAAIGGIVGAIVATEPSEYRNRYEVKDLQDEARREYARRYGSAASELRVLVSLPPKTSGKSGEE